MNSGNGTIKLPLRNSNSTEESSDYIPLRTYQGDKWTPLLALSAAVSTFGFAVPAGYCLGVLNTPVKILQEWANATMVEERGVVMTAAQFDLLWSLIVSVFLIGGVMGGLTGAWFADRWGRRGSLYFGNFLNLSSAVMFLAASQIPSVEMFFVARVIVGFIAGLMTTIVPMYLTELSPPKLAGFMGMLFPMGLTIGILSAQIMGLDVLLGTTTRWPYLVSAYGVMSAIMCIFLPFLPMSPKYLYRILREEEKALHELSRLRNLPIDTVSWEIRSAQSSPRQATQENWNLVRVLATPRLRIPTLLVICLQAGQQFSGINAIFYYSSDIFEKAGLEKEWIPYANIGTGFINFCVTTIGLQLVKSFGRRPLLIVSCAATSLLLVMLTLSSRYMYFASWVPTVSVVFVLTFVFVYDLGLGPIPYFIGAELVDIGPRPVVMALGSVANWGANFIVGASYTTLHNWLHEFIFIGFAVCTLLLTIFLATSLPETRRTTHEAMTEERTASE